MPFGNRSCGKQSNKVNPPACPGRGRQRHRQKSDLQNSSGALRYRNHLRSLQWKRRHPLRQRAQSRSRAHGYLDANRQRLRSHASNQARTPAHQDHLPHPAPFPQLHERGKNCRSPWIRQKRRRFPRVDPGSEKSSKRAVRSANRPFGIMIQPLASPSDLRKKP